MNYSDYNFILYLFNHRHLDIDSLAKKKNYTLSQFNYALESVNVKLESNDIDKISKKGNNIVVTKSILDKTEKMMNERTIVLDQYDRFTRSILMYIYILYNENEWVSMKHLESISAVSKNTVLSDLKYIDSFLERYSLQIKNNRKIGYFIEGREFDKRVVLIDILSEWSDHVGHFEDIQKVLNIEDNQILYVKNVMKEMEVQLNIKFADKYYVQTPIFVLVVLHRIQKNKLIEFKQKLIPSELINDTDFNILENIISTEITNINEELIYFVFYFRSLTLQEAAFKNSYFYYNLNSSIEDFLEVFEKKSFIILNNKKELIRKLYLHINSLFYRLVFDFNADIPPIDFVVDESLYIERMVDASIYPVEQFIGHKLNPEEQQYITMFIASHLLKYNSECSENYKSKMNADKAIVVCENGLLYSTMIKNILENKIESIEFITVLSYRDYMKLNKIDFAFIDYIFTTVRLPKNEKSNIIYINDLSIIDDDWIESVLKKDKDEYLIKRTLTLLKERVNISEEDEAYVYENVKKIEAKVSKDTLEIESILHIEDCFIIDKPDWKQIIKTSSKGLIKRGSINKKYIYSVLNKLPEPDETILLNNSVLIPHGHYNDGVNRLSISISVLKSPIFVKDMPINIVILVAPSKQQHNVKLMDFLWKMTLDNNFIKKIQEAKSSNQVYQLIVERGKEYDDE